VSSRHRRDACSCLESHAEPAACHIRLHDAETRFHDMGRRQTCQSALWGSGARLEAGAAAEDRQVVEVGGEAKVGDHPLAQGADGRVVWINRADRGLEKCRVGLHD
jgi:hypothetical protein